jgi:amidase
VHPDCVDAVNRAAELLAAMGHDVEETSNPFAPDFDDAFLTVWCVAAATLRLPPGTEDTLRPITRHFRERGHAIDASAAFTALATVRELSRRAVGATASYDVLLTPTLAEPPALVGALRNDDDPEFELQAIARFTPFTPPFNASGQPAVNVPMTVNAAGLPIGVQVVARPGRDDVAMALARDLQEASGMRETQASTW